MRTFSGIGLALLALFSTGCARPQPVTSAEAACAVATEKVTSLRGLPTSHVAQCDHISDDNADADHYVMALRAYCTTEAVCGSTLMGWFAVRKTTGEVFEWDVGDWKVGPPLGNHS
ncbi:hypothetical protein [Brevundimonas sp. FT23042]|uniref:hypothetical protein n=1 Tax=Brevundimonas sp. FT23042 TaxID=3393749 RepID=UPI003B586403